MNIVFKCDGDNYDKVNVTYEDKSNLQVKRVLCLLAIKQEVDKELSSLIENPKFIQDVTEKLHTR